MNYYVISDDHLPVAVVFSNPSKGEFHFRSILESLSIILSKAYENAKIKILRDDNKLMIQNNPAIHFGLWIESLLNDTCNGKWHISNTGKINGDDISINETILEYIGWINTQEDLDHNISEQRE